MVYMLIESKTRKRLPLALGVLLTWSGWLWVFAIRRACRQDESYGGCTDMGGVPKVVPTWNSGGRGAWCLGTWGYWVAGDVGNLGNSSWYVLGFFPN